MGDRDRALEPQTPREALLMIREMARNGGNLFTLAQNVRPVAEAGLQSSADFELSDTLADRLARAHTILDDLRRGNVKLADIASDIDEALMLPPDLEAMVERRRR